MTRFETAYAKLIGRLVDDLVALSRALVEDELEKALAAQEKARAAHEKARAAEEKKKQREAPRVSARLKRALERAEERRRLAAERRAAALAARSAEREAGRPDLGSSAKIRRVRSVPEAKVPAPVIPPPLFVHKRSRDGSIQTLERGQRESAPPPPPA